MSWLHRLPYTKSLWKAIHNEEAGDAVFDPICYNFDKLVTAKKRIRNPEWSKVYENLKKCRLSVVRAYPIEFLTIPVTGEPDISKNFTSVKQECVKPDRYTKS